MFYKREQLEGKLSLKTRFALSPPHSGGRERGRGEGNPIQQQRG